MPLRTREIGRALTALALLAIALITLQPRPELAALSAATPVWCLVCGSYGVVDVLLNVLLFIPLGLGLGLAGMRARHVIAAGALLTLCIELLQLSIVSGRDSSLSDLLTNTAGTAIGVLLARHWEGILFPAPPRARALMAAWGVALIAVTALTALAVAPSMPGPPYWGQWTPELGGFVQHEGSVESARVEGIAAPSRRIAESAALADSFADGEVSAEVAAHIGKVTEGMAPIFRMVDGDGEQALLMAQDGADLVIQTGTRSERVRMRPVTLRLEGAFTEAPARVALRSDRRGYEVTVTTPRGSTELQVDREVTWGWAVILPFGGPPAQGGGLMDAVWIGLLVLPLGWLLGVRAVRPSTGIAIAAAAIGAALAVVPLLLGYSITGAAGWTGAAAGLALGLLAGVAACAVRARHRRV